MNSNPLTHEVGMMLGALGCIALYLLLVVHQRDEAEAQLRLEQGRRREAEALAKRRSEQMEGALARISELKGEGDGET